MSLSSHHGSVSLRPSHDASCVRDVAGHTSLSTTETYVHKIESAETTAAAALAMAGTSLAHETVNGED
jgi:hypothetical protein